VFGVCFVLVGQKSVGWLCEELSASPRFHGQCISGWVGWLKKRFEVSALILSVRSLLRRRCRYQASRKRAKSLKLQEFNNRLPKHFDAPLNLVGPYTNSA